MIGRVRKIMVDYPQGWLWPAALGDRGSGSGAVHRTPTQLLAARRRTRAWQQGADRQGADRSRRPRCHGDRLQPCDARSEEHTSELQSLMRISYAVFCLKKKTK